MKKVAMKEWFWSKKKTELSEAYHCQKLAIAGDVVGETEKAYKLSVWALFMSSEKNIFVWVPKSACVAIDAA